MGFSIHFRAYGHHRLYPNNNTPVQTGVLWVV